MAFWRTVKTSELKSGGLVLLKENKWKVVSVNGEDVTVERNGIRRTGRMPEWKYKAPAEETHSGPVHMTDGPDSSDLMTVQEYLRAVGMPEEDLEKNAKTFGTVVMKFYRERHGKDAKATKKLEYVPYLDINGLEAQRPNDDAPPHLRVRQNGWYESNAFPADDLDILERVRKVRHPSLMSLTEANSKALETLRELADGPVEATSMKQPADMRELRWLVEEAVQKCLNSGVVCGHGECTKRRSKQAKRVNSYQMEEMDWS